MPGSIMKAAPTLTNTKRKEKASEVSSWASIPAPHAGRLRPPPKRRTVARAIPVLRSSAAGDDLVEQLMGEADQGRQHERKKQDERAEDHQDLRHEGERHLLDLGQGLDQRDDETDDERDQQDRAADLENHDDGVR